MSYDGIGRNVRNGLNFTERGYGIRGAVGVSDRGNTAASQLRAEDVDWDYIFGKLGVRWLHTGGIFAALSETSAETVIAAVKKAKEYGTVVSYDLNYRPSLWKGIGGLEKARQVNREIAKYIDVMIGNEEDFTACLGLEVEGNDAGLKKLNVEGYCKMIENAVKIYPNFKVVATTLRTVKTATVNDWSAICWADGKLYGGHEARCARDIRRVGGGDSFASGLIYGLMTEGEPQYAVNCGIAHALGYDHAGRHLHGEQARGRGRYERRGRKSAEIREESKKMVKNKYLLKYRTAVLSRSSERRAQTGRAESPTPA